MNLFSASSIPSHRRFVLLAPSHIERPGTLSKAVSDSGEHARLMGEAQRLRGKAYLADGAIKPWQLTPDARLLQAADRNSFHLLSLDSTGHVAACARYMQHSPSVTFSELDLSHTPLASDATAGPFLRDAVERELIRARGLNYGYVEMGGWAIAETLRCSTEAVRMVVTIYALGRLMGGALGVSTATTRHGSSSILRRLGATSLLDENHSARTYFDPNFGCEMELLSFDSDRPSTKYEDAVRRCQDLLAHTTIIAPEMSYMPMPRVQIPALGSLWPAVA